MSLSEEDLRLAKIKINPSDHKQPKFVAYINQSNNGCDYTIACGKTLWKLEAETQAEALAELRHKIAPPIESGEGVYDFEEVTLFCVSDVMIVPLEQWYEEREAEENDRRINLKTQKEQLEYERLRQKFG